MKARLRSPLLYSGLLLGIVALLASSLLAIGHVATKKAIAERLAEDLQTSLAEVIPAELYDNDLLAMPLTIIDTNGQSRRVYRATRTGTSSAPPGVTGVAFDWIAQKGYSGPIKLLLGVSSNGNLLGVRVLSHSETPGLGDKLEVAKSAWILGFNGLSLNNPPTEAWAVRKDGGHFDQFTGATITPRAVVNGVKQGLLFFNTHRDQMMLANSVRSGSDPNTTKAPASPPSDTDLSAQEQSRIPEVKTALPVHPTGGDT